LGMDGICFAKLVPDLSEICGATGASMRRYTSTASSQAFEGPDSPGGISACHLAVPSNRRQWY
jgi:hypothetical protein